jgi:hypothetical protein
VRLATHVLAEALFADRVVFESALALVLPHHLEINQLQLVDVLLTAAHQVQELVDVLHASQHQTHVLVQLRLSNLLLRLGRHELHAFKKAGLEVAGVAADGVGTIEGGEREALLRTLAGLGTLPDLEVLASLSQLRRVRGLVLEQRLLLPGCEGRRVAGEEAFGAGDGGKQGRRERADCESHFEEAALEVGRFGHPPTQP